jgi:hypothetical protein
MSKRQATAGLTESDTVRKRQATDRSGSPNGGAFNKPPTIDPVGLVEHIPTHLKRSISDSLVSTSYSAHVIPFDSTLLY